MKDVDQLLAIHGDKAGDRPGRKHGVEVLNKSAVMLMTACWEAFCEDLCQEAVNFLLENVKQASELPPDVRWGIARSLRNDKDERRLWVLADKGWKPEVLKHSNQLLLRLNTPKSENVDVLFKSAIGKDKISRHWYWPRMSAAKARKKLDRFIELRGALAHRAQAQQAVRKADVLGYKSHISRLVPLTTIRTASYLRDVLGLDKTRTVIL